MIRPRLPLVTAFRGPGPSRPTEPRTLSASRTIVRRRWGAARWALAIAAVAACAPPSRASAPDSAASAPPAAPKLSAPRLAGYLQVRESWQEQAGLTLLLNRVRLSVDGPLPSRFSYRMLTEWQAPTGARSAAAVSLREAFLRWSPESFTLTAGEFKTPFTREYLISTPDLELAGLAVAVDSLAPKYDMGVTAEWAPGPVATFAVGVFNGEGANTTANRDSAVLLVGRVTANPLPRLSLGASVARDGPDSLRWGVDASVEHRGALLRAEYLTRHRRGREQAKDDFGWYVLEAFRLTPRVQAVARQEDFQRPERGDARRVRGLAWGANVDLVPGRVRLLLEFSRRLSGAPPTRADVLLAQLQARF